jgi:hypothetical protein
MFLLSTDPSDKWKRRYNILLDSLFSVWGYEKARRSVSEVCGLYEFDPCVELTARIKLDLLRTGKALGDSDFYIEKFIHY